MPNAPSIVSGVSVTLTVKVVVSRSPSAVRPKVFIVTTTFSQTSTPMIYGPFMVKRGSSVVKK
ncbi:MAG: hypothetical protein ACOX3C_01655 [Bacilli bacterium]